MRMTKIVTAIEDAIEKKMLSASIGVIFGYT